jgi:hypothetical protein
VTTFYDGCTGVALLTDLLNALQTLSKRFTVWGDEPRHRTRKNGTPALEMEIRDLSALRPEDYYNELL